MKNARTLIALCLLVLLTVMLTRDAQAQRQIIRIEELKTTSRVRSPSPRSR